MDCPYPHRREKQAAEHRDTPSDLPGTMSADLVVNTTAGAFVAGLLTSVHCVGMCGPLGCMLAGRQTASPQLAFGAYHLSRVLAYGTLGLMAGMIGQAPIRAMMSSPLVLLPWLLVVALIAIGFGLDRKLPRPKFLTKWLFRSKLRLAQRPPLVAGSLLGLLTPLLPCGPLYLMIGLAAVSGSALAGAEFTVAFALGTVPLLWLSHQPLAHWRQRLSPANLTRMRGAIAFVSAALIAWRLQGTLPFGEASVVTCPLCP